MGESPGVLVFWPRPAGAVEAGTIALFVIGRAEITISLTEGQQVEAWPHRRFTAGNPMDARVPGND
ncbi:MAG: hypothetical protein JO308_09605 [Verrucomicrobia bacterium]|nr:hypothetical protein [Verrucomicrobiota bacterium]